MHLLVELFFFFWWWLGFSERDSQGLCHGTKVTFQTAKLFYCFHIHSLYVSTLLKSTVCTGDHFEDLHESICQICWIEVFICIYFFVPAWIIENQSVFYLRKYRELLILIETVRRVFTWRMVAVVGPWTQISRPWSLLFGFYGCSSYIPYRLQSRRGARDAHLPGDGSSFDTKVVAIFFFSFTPACSRE
jgi:hypothetical protein